MSSRTVYIVDDNAEFRESARFWLSGAGFEVQAFGDPREALSVLSQRRTGQPECLLLDVRMPHLSGLDVHDALRQRGCSLPIIYMSGHADVPLAVQAMRKGAVTVLEKPFNDATLEAALATAFADAQARADAGAAPAATAATGSAAPGAAPAAGDDPAAMEFQRRERSLAPREREVLGHVVQGLYNKVIADRIGLSIKTVELYRARGMAKMQAKSVAELTRMMVSRRAA
jgi:two-component system response regulator FixJ